MAGAMDSPWLHLEYAMTLNKEHHMDLESTNFVTAIHTIEVRGETVDAIELTDGRVLAIDGEAIVLYEDLDSLIDAEDEEDYVERPAIAL